MILALPVCWCADLLAAEKTLPDFLVILEQIHKTYDIYHAGDLQPSTVYLLKYEGRHGIGYFEHEICPLTRMSRVS